MQRRPTTALHPRRTSRQIEKVVLRELCVVVAVTRQQQSERTANGIAGTVSIPGVLQYLNENRTSRTT